MNLAFAVAASLLIGQSGAEPDLKADRAAGTAPVDEVQEGVGLTLPLEPEAPQDVTLDGLPDREQADAGTAVTGLEPPDNDARTSVEAVAAGDSDETDAQTLQRLNDQLQQLEARMAQLEAQATAAQTEVASLREQAATLEEAAAEPGAAADQQRESRQQRVDSVEAALGWVAEAYEILETGEPDLSAPLSAATAALEEGLALAQDADSPGEAQRFEAALRAVAQVPTALAERDYQDAKKLLTLAASEGVQARSLAQSSTTLPVTAR
ncbi:MAG: hypothetical protein M3Y59_25950 [Myxococcota bacterium]|nr:hypothetical protein [Myxococcota bacterium]